MPVLFLIETLTHYCAQNLFVQAKALVAEWDASPTPENGTLRHGKEEKELTAE